MANAERFRTIAKAAANPRQVLSTVTGTAPWATATLSERHEQLQHFHGHQYTAISAIAKRIAGQQVLVAKGKPTPTRGKAFLDSLEPLESHGLLDSIHEPNPVMVGWQLIFTTVASLELAGESYWWFPEPRGGERQQIWALPPSWIEPANLMRDSFKIKPYFNAESVEVDASRIAYFSLPDPSDPFRAHSPLVSQAAAISADESLQRSQAEMFANGLFPRLAFIAGDATDLDDNKRRPLLDDDQRNVIFDALRKMMQGPARYGQAIILDALIRDVKKISNTAEEMDFESSGKMTKSRILQAYGVNPIILGEIEGANRASAAVADKSFCRNVVNPLMELMSQVLTRWACPIFARNGERLIAWFDPARPDDEEMTLQEWQAAGQLGYVTANEYRQRILGLPAIDGGDVRLVPMNMVPADGEA